MRTNRIQGGGLACLGGLVVVYAILGPLVLNVIHFRTSASGSNQIHGGDLAALVVVAPTCFAVAWLACRAHPAAFPWHVGYKPHFVRIEPVATTGRRYRLVATAGGSRPPLHRTHGPHA